jgi:hypothetical protein
MKKVDRRNARRHRVFKEGRIVLGDSSVINCIIRDLSYSGARLKLSVSMALPDTFDLLIVSEGLLFPSRRVWRRGDHVGISFEGEPRFLRKKKQGG